MSVPMFHDSEGLPVELRLERLEANLRRLRHDLEGAEVVLGEESSLVELLRSTPPAWDRQAQLAHLFD